MRCVGDLPLVPVLEHQEICMHVPIFAGGRWGTKGSWDLCMNSDVGQLHHEEPGGTEPPVIEGKHYMVAWSPLIWPLDCSRKYKLGQALVHG